MKNKLRKFFKWSVLTNIGRIVTSFILGTISLGISQVTEGLTSDIFYYIFLTFVAVLVGYGLTLIAFAWIINPVREHCGYYRKKAGKGEIKNSKFCKAIFKNVK